MSGNYIDTAFAESGDLTAVPDSIQPDGSVSFPQGYGSDYELPLTSPGALPIERQKMNWLFNFITLQLQQYQQQSTPLFITSTENGGVPFVYSIGVEVIYNPGSGNRFYRSLRNTNTDLPTVAASWADVTIPFSGNTYTGGTSTGSANAQVIVTEQGNFTNTAGNVVTWLNGFSNTGAMTVNPDGAGNIPVKIRTTAGLADPPAGAVTSGQQSMGISDGTNIQLISPSQNLAFFLQAANNLSDLGNLVTALTNLTFASNGSTYFRVPNPNNTSRPWIIQFANLGTATSGIFTYPVTFPNAVSYVSVTGWPGGPSTGLAGAASTSSVAYSNNNAQVCYGMAIGN